MTDFDEIIGGNTQEHNPHWPQILNHSYRILIVDNFGSFKTNVLISIINHQPEIHKIFLHAKDPYALKYQYLKKKFVNRLIWKIIRTQRLSWRNLMISRMSIKVLKITILEKQERVDMTLGYDCWYDQKWKVWPSSHCVIY